MLIDSEKLKQEVRASCKDDCDIANERIRKAIAEKAVGE